MSLADDDGIRLEELRASLKGALSTSHAAPAHITCAHTGSWTKPHGRCSSSVLQLYLSVFHPPSPTAGFRLLYIQGHSDEQDQDPILAERRTCRFTSGMCNATGWRPKPDILPRRQTSHSSIGCGLCLCTVLRGRRPTLVSAGRQLRATAWLVLRVSCKDDSHPAHR
jgi:hypothetical protein